MRSTAGIIGFKWDHPINEVRISIQKKSHPRRETSLSPLVISLSAHCFCYICYPPCCENQVENSTSLKWCCTQSKGKAGVCVQWRRYIRQVEESVSIATGSSECSDTHRRLTAPEVDSDSRHVVPMEATAERPLSKQKAPVESTIS